MQEEIDPSETNRLDTLKHYSENFLKIKKVDIHSTFGFYKKLANGDVGKILMMPDLTSRSCTAPLNTYLTGLNIVVLMPKSRISSEKH